MVQIREPVLGLPYASLIERSRQWGHVCPACDAFCIETTRKDDESFTNDAYAAHYAAKHSEQGGDHAGR